VLETLLDGREPGLKREIVLSGWESARRFSCGNGARPRIWSAAFFASIIVGAFKLPLVICGMIDAGKQLVPYRWKRPERQPQRRPKGSRNKSSKRFDVHAVWEEGGLEIPKAAAVKDPAKQHHSSLVALLRHCDRPG
jgi:hypothetical protein